MSSYQNTYTVKKKKKKKKLKKRVSHFVSPLYHHAKKKTNNCLSGICFIFLFLNYCYYYCLLQILNEWFCFFFFFFLTKKGEAICTLYRTIRMILKYFASLRLILIYSRLMAYLILSLCFISSLFMPYFECFGLYKLSMT